MGQLKAKWAALSSVIRVIIMAIGIALPLGIGVWLFMPSPYQVLYTGLSPEDTAAIERYLSDHGVDYRVQDGTVEVNGDLVKLKRELAMEGLPTGGVTSNLDSFGKTSIGSTRYDKDVQYQAGLQKDLNKNLTEMFEGILKAEVKLPKPKEKSIFEDKNEPVQISVALKLRPGTTLDEEQVTAIQVFVAGALNDVKPENVKVVDSKMNVLSNFEKDGKGSGKQQEIVEEARNQLEKKLTDTLSDVYGSVKVMASVDINFDEIVQNIKKYDPEGTLLSKETDKDASRTIEGAAEIAEPGTDANGEVPNYQLEDLEKNGTILQAQDKEHIIENFQVGETVEQIIKHPELRNLNVAVWVDGNLSEPEIVELEEMIAVASGLTGVASRDENNKAIYANGSVKVSQKTFKSLEEPEEEVIVEKEPEIKTLEWPILAGIGGVILLILLIILTLALRSRRKQKREFDELLRAQEEKNRLDKEEIARKEAENAVENDLLQGMSLLATGPLSKEQMDLRETAGEAALKHTKETANWIKKQLEE